jgi:hypothetical protein
MGYLLGLLSFFILSLSGEARAQVWVESRPLSESRSGASTEAPSGGDGAFFKGLGLCYVKN